MNAVDPARRERHREFPEVGSGEGKIRCSHVPTVGFSKPAAMARKFLIVEHNPEGQFLLSKTLKRKFPDAEVRGCQDADAALAAVKDERWDALIVHRSADVDGTSLTKMLREVGPDNLILMVSGYDRAKEALAAGATIFLSYDEWLRVGTVLADALTSREANSD
ncbi:MAG TPA: response regulator [Opitutaceae bacterium]|nr:response regulator [Opitutaceae bacterium]